MRGPNFLHGQVDENPDDGSRNVTADKVRIVLSVDQTENPDIKKTPEQLFDERIRPKIHEMVMALGLAPVIEKCRSVLSESDGSPTTREEKAIQIFMTAFNEKQLPFKKWAFFPEVIIAEGETDLSGAALIVGAILNQELGINFRFIQSDDGQASVITYTDERKEYVNFRSELKGKSKSDGPKNKIKIAMDKVDDVRLHNLPTAEFKRGAMLTLSENIQALRSQQSSDPKANETLSRYADAIDKY